MGSISRAGIAALMLVSIGGQWMEHPANPRAATAAIADDPAFDLDAAKAAVAELADAIERSYVFPETGKRYAAMLRGNLKNGAYDGYADPVAFAEAVTNDIQAIAFEGHLTLRPPLPAASGAPAGAPPPAPVATMEQAGWIAPGIAYVRFNSFEGQPDVLAALTRFLDEHEGARALIIDARTHRGGGLDEIDLLFERLFDKPATVMIMDMRHIDGAGPGPDTGSLVRVAGPEGIDRDEHRITPRMPASRWAKMPVYVLTSGRTASAAEHLSTVLKETHRATLIGETTAGAGNFGRGVRLPGGYYAFIPFGHSYFPGREGWEGVGVTPDIAVAPERALVEVLVRLGIAPDAAERLSQSHQPTGSMARRRPLRN